MFGRITEPPGYTSSIYSVLDYDCTLVSDGDGHGMGFWRLQGAIETSASEQVLAVTGFAHSNDEPQEEEKDAQ